MKTHAPLALLAAVLLVGCSADKSDQTQTMAPTGGTPKEGTPAVGNPNIPANIKGQIPPK